MGRIGAFWRYYFASGDIGVEKIGRIGRFFAENDVF
jgi:hypothetical protein